MSGCPAPLCPAGHLDHPVYIHLHGPDHDHLYARLATETMTFVVGRPIVSGDGHGLDVYAYFNNDGHGHAVTNARRLRSLVAS